MAAPPAEILSTMAAGTSDDDAWLAEKIFERMRAAGMVPDVEAFNTLIAACTAEEIFERMGAAGLVPDGLTFCFLINVCGKHGDVERADEMFERAKAAGMVPAV